jgi:hypothetical protein
VPPLRCQEKMALEDRFFLSSSTVKMTMLMMTMMANADYIYCLFFLLLYCILMWREDEEAWQETKLWSTSRTVNLFWFLQECWQDASSSAPITSQPSQASLSLSLSLSLSPKAVGTQHCLCTLLLRFLLSLSFSLFFSPYKQHLTANLPMTHHPG